MLNSQAVDLKGKSHLNRQILHGKDDYPWLRIVAAVLLGVHVLEVLICFRQVALHKGSLFDSVLLTLLFGVLHWKPTADAARRPR